MREQAKLRIGFILFTLFLIIIWAYAEAESIQPPRSEASQTVAELALALGEFREFKVCHVRPGSMASLSPSGLWGKAYLGAITGAENAIGSKLTAVDPNELLTWKEAVDGVGELQCPGYLSHMIGSPEGSLVVYPGLTSESGLYFSLVRWHYGDRSSGLVMVGWETIGGNAKVVYYETILQT